MIGTRVSKRASSKPKRRSGSLGKRSVNTNIIMAWEDDPMSTDAKLVSVRVADKLQQRFTIEIDGPQKLAIYKPGTDGFRYWNAFDALHRSVKFWRTTLERAKCRAKDWVPGSPIRVGLVEGDELNAYYDRKRLSFFRARVGGTVVYSGESPDVLAHELGHAVLDSIQRKLWAAASDEIAAFHESFADISSICTALQLESLRRAAINETGVTFYGSSRVSRLAEQLGWAIRQVRADASEADCLRNAVNTFCYQPPHTLPYDAPSTMLSSEPHSFSRVFTSAFFGMLCNMFDGKRSGKPKADELLDVTNDAAVILVKAIEAATVRGNFYNEVAQEMLVADQETFSGEYEQAIRSSFVRRGILPLRIHADWLAHKRSTQQSRPRRRAQRVAAIGNTASAAMVDETEYSDFDVPDASENDDLRMLTLPGRDFGIQIDNLLVEAVEAQDYSYSAVPIAALGRNLDAEEEAKLFLEHLIRRSKVDLGNTGKNRGREAHPMISNPHLLSRKTHALTAKGDTMVLERRLFE